MSAPFSDREAQAFIDIFEIAARQAGAIGLRLQGRVENEGKAGGQTPEATALSAVDLAAQDVVLELLHHHFPHVSVDAEEDTETARLFDPPGAGRDLVVLDPIDGSLSYLMGTKDWAVMAALIRDGHYAASALLFPAYATYVAAARGEGCYVRRGRGPFESVRFEDELPPIVLVGPRFPEEARRALEPLGVGAETCRCSAVESTASILGRGRAAMTHHKVGRRHAIGLFASLEAGATVLFGDKPFSGEDPKAVQPEDGPTVVAARSDDAHRFLDAVRPLVA